LFGKLDAVAVLTARLLPAPRKADANFGAATMLLYFAVSLATQNIVLGARAWRLRDGGADAERHPASSRPGRPW
jgi:hypothetical protein